MSEKYESEFLAVEVAFNENAKNDRVYFLFDQTEGTVETYLSISDFRGMLKAMLRLDDQIGQVT